MNGLRSKQKMRILQVNSRDTKGGAANVAHNLHRAYQSKGLESFLLVGEKETDDPRILPVNHNKYKSLLTKQLLVLSRKFAEKSSQIRGLGRISKLFQFIAEFPRDLNLYLGREDFYAPGTTHILEMVDGPVDILHLHNLHKSWLKERTEIFDLRALSQLSKIVPIVMTLRDAWLLSGHCAQLPRG